MKRKTRKPRSPRATPRKPRAPRHPRVVKHTVAPVRPVVPFQYGMQPTFPKRHTPLSQAELDGLEIPAFLRREPVAHVTN
jgi:hypothetical protein